MQQASELSQFSLIPAGAVLIIISCSGRSLEIVNLRAQARERAALVVGIASSEDGPLAREAQIPIVIPIEVDHAISVNAYTSLAAAAGALASATIGCLQSLMGSRACRPQKTV